MRVSRGGLLRRHCETRPADTRDALYGCAQKDTSAKSPLVAEIGCARGISSGADPKKPAPHPPVLRAPRGRKVLAPIQHGPLAGNHEYPRATGGE